MKTEYRFAEALKTLMAEQPLDEITVTKLAKKCKVNRQTFYYHFTDIYDLLTLVFLEEKINKINEVKSLEEMVRTIYSYYLVNKKFIDATLNSSCKDLFQEFVYNNCYNAIKNIISSNPESKKLHINDRKSIARFYAYGYSQSIVYYLSTYKNKTIDGLLLNFAFVDESNIEKAITKFLSYRGKQARR